MLRFTVNTNNLVKFLEAVNVMKFKKGLDVTKNIQISKEGLYFSNINTGLFLEQKIDIDCEIQVDYSKLLKIIKGLIKIQGFTGNFLFEYDNKHLKVGSYRLIIQDNCDYPKRIKAINTVANLEYYQFEQLIKNSKFTYKDTNRLIFTGIGFRDNQAVVSNGNSIFTIKNIEASENFTMSSINLLSIKKWFPAGGIATIQDAGQNLIISNDNFHFITSKIEGTYPNINKVLNYADKKIEFNVDELQKFEQLLKLIDDDKMYIRNDKIECFDEEASFEDHLLSEIDIVLSKKMTFECLKNVNFEDNYQVFTDKDSRQIKIEDNNNILLILSLRKS